MNTREAVLSKIKKGSIPRGEELTKPTEPIFVSFVGSPSHISEPKNEEPESPRDMITGMLSSGPLPERVAWESPLFGRMESPVLEMTETHFSLIHPLTGEIVELPNEWLVSMEERSAIMEFDGGIPREEADRKAQGMMFDQFRQGGDEDGYV